MRVKELLELAWGRVIAESAYDGHIMFDTAKNKREYIQKYFEHRIENICGDVVTMRGKYDYCHQVYPAVRIAISRYPVVEEAEHDQS